MKSLISFITVAGVFFTSLCYGLTVTFTPNTEVTDTFITLADVARFNEKSTTAEALGTQVIERSPEPGEQLTLSSSEIIQDIYRKTPLSRSVEWKGASTVTVVRKGQLIQPRQLTDAVNDYLLDNRELLPKARLQFIPESLPLPFMLPEGRISWDITPSHPSILQSGRFSIILSVDGRVRKNLSMPGRIEALAPVAVASQNLRRGEVLTPANTMMVERDISQLSDPLLSQRALIGKRVKHGVRSGNVIHSSHVEFPPLVEKGQLVKIILNHGPLFLSATGVARRSGKMNDIIRVQNTSSKKLIFCRVTAPGIVEVQI